MYVCMYVCICVYVCVYVLNCVPSMRSAVPFNTPTYLCRAPAASVFALWYQKSK